MAKTGNTEHLVFHIQAEPTNREKEHVSPWTLVHSSICANLAIHANYINIRLQISAASKVNVLKVSSNFETNFSGN